MYTTSHINTIYHPKKKGDKIASKLNANDLKLIYMTFREKKKWNERRSIEQHSLHTFRSSYQQRNSALLNCYINSGKHMPWLTELTLLLSCMTSDCRRRISVAHPFGTTTLTHTMLLGTFSRVTLVQKSQFYLLAIFYSIKHILCGVSLLHGMYI